MEKKQSYEEILAELAAAWEKKREIAVELAQKNPAKFFKLLAGEEGRVDWYEQAYALGEVFEEALKSYASCVFDESCLDALRRVAHDASYNLDDQQIYFKHLSTSKFVLLETKNCVLCSCSLCKKNSTEICEHVKNEIERRDELLKTSSRRCKLISERERLLEERTKILMFNIEGCDLENRRNTVVYTFFLTPKSDGNWEVVLGEKRCSAKSCDDHLISWGNERCWWHLTKLEEKTINTRNLVEAAFYKALFVNAEEIIAPEVPARLKKVREIDEELERIDFQLKELKEMEERLEIERVN